MCCVGGVCKNPPDSLFKFDVERARAKVVTMRFPRMLPEELSLGSITRAALQCFVVNGYHGTSIRQIASAAGLSVPGVYHHYASKQSILVELCDITMQELIDASQAAMSCAGDSVLDRFDALVECLVAFHADFADVAFVTFSEIRSLDGEARQRHLAARRQEQELLTSLVEAGVQEGVFTTEDPRHVARAISSICLGISQWYRPERGLSVDALAETHVRICRDAARCVVDQISSNVTRSTSPEGAPG